MAVILQIRRDYAANWTAANPILAQGEIALEIDEEEPGNGKFKVGDGINAWNDLQYGGFGGVAGPDGEDGATWHHGVAVPANTYGANLDYFWRTTDGNVYQKQSNVWTLVGSIRGPQGVQGETGLTGSTWHDGTGAPSAGIGNVGDHYLDRVTKEIYLKGISGWNVIAAVGGNIDGGTPSSTYGGIDPIDGGTP